MVFLPLPATVVEGDKMTVCYPRPATNPLRNAVGEVRNFSDVSVMAAPVVSDEAISSTPAAGDTYGDGETIRVTLTFSESVDVDTAGGKPRLKIKMDPGYGEKWADYASGSGTTMLEFTYTVKEPNLSPQGIAVLANTLDLNGGTIVSTSSTVAADLSHKKLAPDSEHKVDWRQ